MTRLRLLCDGACAARAHVIIDFANVREADDAAVANLARMLGAHPESRVTFRGLSRHLRRVLR